MAAPPSLSTHPQASVQLCSLQFSSLTPLAFSLQETIGISTIFLALTPPSSLSGRQYRLKQGTEVLGHSHHQLQLHIIFNTLEVSSAMAQCWSTERQWQGCFYSTDSVVSWGNAFRLTSILTKPYLYPGNTTGTRGRLAGWQIRTCTICVVFSGVLLVHSVTLGSSCSVRVPCLPALKTG